MAMTRLSCGAIILSAVLQLSCNQNYRFAPGNSDISGQPLTRLGLKPQADSESSLKYKARLGLKPQANSESPLKWTEYPSRVHFSGLLLLAWELIPRRALDSELIPRRALDSELIPRRALDSELIPRRALPTASLIDRRALPKVIASSTSSKTLRHSRYPVNSIAFIPRTHILASGGYDDIARDSRDGTIKLWNTDNGQLLRTLKGHTDEVRAIVSSPDGNILASGSHDNTIKLWNPNNGQLLRTLTGHTDWVGSVAISPDGKTLASGSFDNTIKIWDLHSGQLLRTLTGHSAPVQSVAFSPISPNPPSQGGLGGILASASNDKTVKLWNTRTGQLQNTLTEHTDFVLCVAFSPDGKTLASAGYDKTIKLWNLRTAKLQNTLKGHSDLVPDIAISADGKILASVEGSWDNTVKLWDLRSGEFLRDLRGHTSNFVIKGESVAFSPQGNILASGNNDGIIDIWQVEP